MKCTSLCKDPCTNLSHVQHGTDGAARPDDVALVVRGERIHHVLAAQQAPRGDGVMRVEGRDRGE